VPDLPVLMRNTYSPFSGPKNKPSSKLLYFMLELLFDPEDGGNTLLRNVHKLAAQYTESNIREQCSPKLPPEESHIA
jgi:hypothetical protein